MSNRFIREIRKYIKEMDKYPKFNLGSLLVVILCVFLIITSTFTEIKINFLGEYSYYILQIPVILFVGALLGPNLGKMPILIYITAGLIGIPVFASGGGFNYYIHYGFGYILGYFFAVQIVGKILYEKTNLENLLIAAIAGTLTVHICGLLYLSSLILLQKHSPQLIFAWGMELSGKIMIDMIYGFLAVLSGRLARKVLWIAMD